MTDFCIVSDYFHLCFQPKVFERDVQYPSNTILTVCVNSDGFCADTTMDIDIKEFVSCVDALSALYTKLKGTVVIKEPFGRQFIEFAADQTGHIHISGALYSNGRHGFVQELVFENLVDQTYLPDFISNLAAFCAQYR